MNALAIFLSSKSGCKDHKLSRQAQAYLNTHVASTMK